MVVRQGNSRQSGDARPSRGIPIAIGFTSKRFCRASSQKATTDSFDTSNHRALATSRRHSSAARLGWLYDTALNCAADSPK
jgi:hypothetical protein